MGEKTEKATPKKRRDERKKGNVFLSKDVVSIVTLIASVMILRMTIHSSAGRIGEYMTYCIASIQDGDVLRLLRDLMLHGLVVVAQVTGPLFAVTILGTVVSTMGQTRLLVAWEKIKPKFDKLNPISGVKNLFSLKSLVEALKNIIKITVLLVIIYQSLRDVMAETFAYLYADVTGTCNHLLNAVFVMLLKVILGFIVVAAFDFLYQWWDFERQMRMSKQEIKEEFKQTEGDPQVKGKIKEKQRQMAQQRMMQQVPDSDVVVRNPTHVAVALRYRPGEDAAPVVLAKGLDLVALRIIAIAEDHDILTIENKPLARALYASAELNQMIPPEFYDAVADIMIYLYKLNRIQMPDPSGNHAGS